MSSQEFPRYDVLGVPISVTTLESASNAIHKWSRDRVARFVFIRDVHGVMQALSDPVLLTLHSEAAMVTPDGMPLVWLGQLAGLKVKRTCGPDLMDKVLLDSNTSGLRHYFYGGKPGVALQLKESFVAKYPQLQVVGVDTPPFRPLTPQELKEVANEINQSEADVVWVGISTPKQELLMHALSYGVNCTLIGVGAAFDFHTGVISRAPMWMRTAGLEWSWRLVSEPKRLWRRYLVLAPIFIWRVLLSRFNWGRTK
jgi:N-acetylglucosaminyldiphosphoundecaprenol N-acetyl-beta-D-mannosaminyltransferase